MNESDKPTQHDESANTLRRTAEERVANLPALPEVNTLDDAQKILHELRVHQIELKMQYEELLRMQDDYRMLYEHMPYGYISIDKANRVVRANQAFADILGSDNQKVIGPSLLYSIAKPDIPSYIEYYGRFSPRLDEPLHIHLLDAEKNPVPVEVCYAGSFEYDEETTCFNLSIRDRREEIESKRQTQQLEDRLRSCLDHIDSGFLSLDEDLRIQYANKTAIDLLHATDDIIGELLFDDLYPEMMDSIFENTYRKVLKTGEAEDFEVNLDFAPYNNWYHIHCFPSPDGLAVLFDLITEKKLAKQQMIRSERLAAVGILGAGVAHQFNNLNAPVLGFCDLILRQDDLSEKVTRWAKSIREASLRARDITRSLLTFAGSGHSEDYQQRSLNDILHETLILVEHDFHENGIALEVNTTEIPGVTVNASEISQILLNLLINAKHAVMDAPKKRISIDSGASNKQVYLRVCDTGCGIPQENQNKIFSPFFTTKGEFCEEDTSWRDLQGTGLGLSVAQMIIERHGGRIELESAPGKGACFTLRLPATGANPIATSATSTHHESAQSLSPTTTKRSILILEDDVLTGNVLHDILQEFGYGATVAEDGYHALLECREKRYDFVLVDLHMPKMSGVEFLRRLGELPESQRPIPVLVTGSSQEEVARVVATTQVEIVVRKPFRPSELVQVLEKQLGG